MLTQKRLDKVLGRLGTTSQEIADKLKELGIKGKQTDAFSCPIARYLKIVDFDDYTVSSFAVRCKEGFKGVKNYTIPKVVGEFVTNFDLDCYPDLIE